MDWQEPGSGQEGRSHSCRRRCCISKKATRGKTTSDTFVYVGTNGGSVDPAGAADAVLSYYRATQRDLIPFLQVDGEYINDKHALVTASINKTSIQSHSILLEHRLISINPFSHAESMQRLARSPRTIGVQ